MLTPDEVAGVMAHELAHIKNRDTLIMTISATIAGAISTLAQFGFLFGGRGDDRPNPIVMLATAILAPLAAMIIQMAISRSREYDADRMGAEIIGQPLALASALAKIAGGVPHIPNEDAERHPATAPLFIINPLSGHGMDNLFSTHPATENRIAALQELAQCDGLDRQSAAVLPRPATRANPWGLRRARRPSRPLGLSGVASPSPGSRGGRARRPRRACLETRRRGPGRRVPLDDVFDDSPPRRRSRRATRPLPAPSPSVTFRRLGTIRRGPGGAPRPRPAEGSAPAFAPGRRRRADPVSRRA